MPNSSSQPAAAAPAFVPAEQMEILISHEQIHARISEIGAQITKDYAGESIVLVGVLKGAAIFLSDLARQIKVDATFDFVAVSSYGKGTRSSGAVKLIKDLDNSIEGKNIIIVEDILDTGLTLNFLRKLMMQQHPKTMRIATFLDKPSRRIQQIEADYTCFSVPNHFVVGYGMDFNEQYRNVGDVRLYPENPHE